MIPEGCNGVIQLLDVSVNRALKDMLREEMDNYIDQEKNKVKLVGLQVRGVQRQPPALGAFGNHFVLKSVT